MPCKIVYHHPQRFSKNIFQCSTKAHRIIASNQNQHRRYLHNDLPMSMISSVFQDFCIKVGIFTLFSLPILMFFFYDSRTYFQIRAEMLKPSDYFPFSAGVFHGLSAFGIVSGLQFIGTKLFGVWQTVMQVHLGDEWEWSLNF